MSGHGHLLTLLVLVFLGAAAPALAVRLRLPAAVLLILAGIAFGPSGTGWLADDATLGLLSELGFLVLMFLAGLEIDFAALRSAGLRSLLAPGLTVLGFCGVGAAIGIWRNLSVIDLLILTASSVGMPLAVLHETGQLQRPLGRYVMLTASIGEFVSILAITGYELAAEHGEWHERALRVVKVLLLFVVSALVIRWARAIVWWRPEPFRRLTRHHDVAELGVRSGLLVMFAFVVVAASLGVEAILGAFIAGALVAFVLREKATLEHKLGALGQGLFIPIFFIAVGVRFDVRLLDREMAGAALVAAAIVAAIKILPALVAAPAELRLRDRLAAGTLLSAPLTLVVAMAAIGRRLGALEAKQQTAFVLLALLLSVVFPVAFRALASGEKPALKR